MSEEQDLGSGASKIELERRLDVNAVATKKQQGAGSAGKATAAKGGIKGRRIAILATDGFEQSELMEPKKRFEEAGADVDVLAPDHTQRTGEIRGWYQKNWGESVDIDLKVGDARPGDYDALVLPGGVINPDQLRLDKKALSFIKAFAASGKPLAAICHGPITLVNVDLVRHRKLTSWPSISADLINAGAQWVDSEVVIDGQFITSRKPDDIPAFSTAVINAVAVAAN